MKRVFWLVADSFGVGELPDAADYGDKGANTLRSVRRSKQLYIPCMESLGLYRIDGVSPTDTKPVGIYGRMIEASKGKDTVTGHWEMCGIVSERPFPVYLEGFPKDVLDAFSKAIGREVLCNLPYSGTKVLEDYGAEHCRTGKPIVYTSADSVFQIAAHVDVIPTEILYEYCRMARQILQGEHAVGRVIARPFEGEYPFRRTENRKDFPLPPPQKTVLDDIRDSGLDVLAVGKIGDIFSMQGITEHYKTHGNTDGLRTVEAIAQKDFHGLCYVNLVDFDMLYGHRRDVDGYAAALTELDEFLTRFLPTLGEDDALVITGDHGCDPAFSGTDHTREYVPILMYNKNFKPTNLGTCSSFAVLGNMVKQMLGVE